VENNIGFCVVYRFKIRPGSEERFRQGWTRMTEAIREQRSGLGSRLHLSGDGWWVAYAQWPDRQTWERSQQMEAADVDAQQMMADAIEERMPPILLEPKVDLLVAAS
jgi:quinol monooxygenase YgiN